MSKLITGNTVNCQTAAGSQGVGAPARNLQTEISARTAGGVAGDQIVVSRHRPSRSEGGGTPQAGLGGYYGDHVVYRHGYGVNLQRTGRCIGSGLAVRDIDGFKLVIT